MLKLFKNHPYPLSLALLVFFVGGIGQTYLLALFNPYLTADLAISAAALGTLYSGATLAASFSLPFVGKLIDRFSVRDSILLFAPLLATGLLVLSFSYHWVLIFLGLFLIRAIGQSGINIVASTYLSKLFGSKRGKSLAISQIGRPLAETILPLLVSFTILNYSWRFGLQVLAFLVLAIFIPLVLLLYRRSEQEEQQLYPEKAEVEKLRENKEWNLKQVYAEKRIYFLIASNVFIPFFMTGLFFSHGEILQEKALDPKIWAQSFGLYALFQLLHSFGAGHLIDRYSAHSIYPLIPIPLFLGTISLVAIDGPWSARIFLALAGASVGIYATTKNSFLAEVYGLKNLASIKGLDSTWMVISTAISPILFPFLLKKLSFAEFSSFLVLVCFLGLGCFVLSWRAYLSKIRS